MVQFNNITNLFLLSFIEVYGDFAFERFAHNNNNSDFIKGVLGYIFVVYFLVNSLREKNILYVNGMWDGLSALIETAAAYFILNQRLEKKRQYVGIVMLICGLVLLKN